VATETTETGSQKFVKSPIGRGVERKERKRGLHPRFYGSNELAGLYERRNELPISKKYKRKPNKIASPRRQLARYRKMKFNLENEGKEPSDTMAAWFEMGRNKDNYVKITEAMARDCLAKSKTLWNAYVCGESKSVGSLPLGALVGGYVWHPLVAYLLKSDPGITVAKFFELLIQWSANALPNHGEEKKGYKNMFQVTAPQRFLSIPEVYRAGYPIPTNESDFYKLNVLNPTGLGYATNLIPQKLAKPDALLAAKQREQEIATRMHENWTRIQQQLSAGG